MKALFRVMQNALLKIRVPFLLRKPYLFKEYVCNIFFFICVFLSAPNVAAQDIAIINPSMEGKVAASGRLPKPWLIFSQSPDQQPGLAGFSFPASDGEFFIAAVLTAGWQELFGQTLATPLKAGKTYTLSVDLAYAPFYTKEMCNASFAIYGANKDEKPELLWESGDFFHTSWKRYSPVFTPAKDYQQIVFGPNSLKECKQRSYATVLVDNFSPTIREMPQITVATTATCKGISNGEATVKLLGGHGPVTYLWAPGGQTTGHVSNLAAGIYKVTVMSANEASVTIAVNIKETDLKSEVKTILSKCNGDMKNEIVLQTTGGAPPYRYYINNEDHASYVPRFSSLRPGTYQVSIKDEHECEEKFEKIVLAEPLPLQIQYTDTKPVSCSETADGKIFLHAAGGTLPYSYRLEAGQWQTDSVLARLDKGRYYFQIKDNNSCMVNGAADVDKNIRECAVFVPTAFTPNSDGQNDLFRIRVNDDVHDLRLVVYNRWGQRVFTTTDPQGYWNGEIRGNPPVAATYIWVLTYTDSKQQARKQTGTLALIR